MYGAVQGLRSNGNTSDVYALVAGIFAALFAGCLIFWAWFALAVIGEGDAYNCIGGCNSYTLYNNATNNSFVFLVGEAEAELQDGSGSFVFLVGEAEAEEQDGSGFFNISNSNSTGDMGLNKAVVGVYVVGWIIAVVGIGYASLAAFNVLA